MRSVVKIGLVGPESTGKSTLGKQLAARYGGRYVAEYAREFVGSLGRPYTYEDVCHVAEVNRQEACLSAVEGQRSKVKGRESNVEDLVFFDTELIVTKVWLDEVYGRRPEWLTEPVPEECRMDLYLVLKPDFPAEPDPLRENTEQSTRERLFDVYLREVRMTGRPYAIVEGVGAARLACCDNSLKLLRNE